jgi:uncharacterized protein
MKASHIGLDAFQKQDYAKAARELPALARQGNATAQYYLARMYHEGTGLPENNAAAAHWSRQAAEQGLAPAEAMLGALYAQGQGVARDDDEAARWLHRAARQGHPAGLAKMGMCYMHGFGVPQDYVQAYMWFDLAASRSTGHDYMCNCGLRDVFAAMNLTPAQIAEAKRLAREWKPQQRPLLKRLHLA